MPAMSSDSVLLFGQNTQVCDCVDTKTAAVT